MADQALSIRISLPEPRLHRLKWPFWSCLKLFSGGQVGLHACSCLLVVGVDLMDFGLDVSSSRGGLGPASGIRPVWPSLMNIVSMPDEVACEERAAPAFAGGGVAREGVVPGDLVEQVQVLEESSSPSIHHIGRRLRSVLGNWLALGVVQSRPSTPATQTGPPIRQTACSASHAIRALEGNLMAFCSFVRARRGGFSCWRFCGSPSAASWSLA